MTISELLRRANHALTFSCGQGSWALLEHESTVLNAALNILDNETRTLVEEQLNQSYFVERMPQGRINVFRFYHPRDSLRIEAQQFDDLLIKVKFEIEGRQQTAHVTFYKGYIFSIEFNRPKSFYKGNALAIRDVVIGKSSQSYTAAIDRIEHGKNP